MNDEFDLTTDNGIFLPHFSVSTVNKFIEDRFGFYQQKVKGERFKPNLAMLRGTCVEHGINSWLETGNEDVVAFALNRFDLEVIEIECSKEDSNDIRKSIPGLTNTAFEFYSSLFMGKTAITQQKVLGKFAGVEREVVGYLDFIVPSQMVRDSKVVGRTPPKLKQGYVIQGAFYKHVTGLDVFFDFFVDNKKPVHVPIKLTDSDYSFGLSYLIEAMKTLEKIQLCDNPKEMMRLMSFPNLDAMWTESDRKAAAKEWNIEY